MAKTNEIISVASGLCATPKKQYIEECVANISKMKREIEQLEQEKAVLEPGSFEFFRCQKRIAKRHSIIKDCEQSIFAIGNQINLPTHARFRGL